MARYRRSKHRRHKASARRVSRRARRHQSRLGLRMGRGGFRKGRRKGRVHAKWSTVKKYRRLARNPAQFPVPFMSALNPGRKRRGRKSSRRSGRSSRKSWVRHSKRKEKWARKKARWYQGRHRAKSRRGGNSKRTLNRALYHARGGRYARNCGGRW